MATAQQTIEHLLDQLRDAPVTARRMFGEYCLYYAGKPVALVCDDQLFVKPTEAGRTLVEPLAEGTPFPGARLHLLIDADRWEERDWLAALLRATADALPQPKPRKSSSKRTRKSC